MPNNFDPLDLDDDEAAWMKQKTKADQRRKAAHAMAPNLAPPQLTEMEYDAQRKAQMEKDQAARAAAVTPATLSGTGKDPLDIDFSVSVPGSESLPSTAGSVVPGKTPTPGGVVDISFWVCRLTHHTVYAVSWEDLKTRLKDHEGAWTATEHKLPATSEAILGHFCPEQYPQPQDTAQRTFELIVRDHKIFRTE